VLNCLNWDWTLIRSGKGGIEESWTGTWYDEFVLYTSFYFVFDFLWVSFQPSCVKSPVTIQMVRTYSWLVSLHVACAVYWTTPLMYFAAISL
jgi:hypothetical protein